MERILGRVGVWRLAAAVVVATASLCAAGESAFAGANAGARADATGRARSTALAREILDATGVAGGLIVDLGCGGSTGSPQAGSTGTLQPGELAVALRSGEQYLVHGLDADEAKVEQARRLVESLGLAGCVSFARLAGARLPYADNLVNLLVAEDLGAVPMAEVMRVLSPLGTAYICTGGKWARTVKPRPDGMDEWTHWLHGPDGNAVARDRLVGPPRQMQWTAGPLWSRHHNLMPSVSAMVSAGGRVFYIVDEAPAAMTGDSPDKWSLTARDAFNGIELWRKPIADWGWKAWSTHWEGRFNQPNEITKRLVAAGDKVYATLGFNAPLTCLDAATGKVLKTYAGTDFTDEVLYLDGVLIVSINHSAQRAGKTTRDPNTKKDAFVGLLADPPVEKSIAAIDAATGRLLWKTGDFVGNSTKTGPMERITHLLLAARGSQVYLLDRDSVVSLDLKTGVKLWRTPRRASPRYTSRYDHLMSDMCTLVATDDVVLLNQLAPVQKTIGWRVIEAGLRAYSAKTGKVLWDYDCGNWAHFSCPDTFVVGGLVWVHDKKDMSIVGLDLAGGVEKRRLSTESAFDNGHHHRCYRNKATEKYLVTSFRGYEFTDWQSNDVSLNHWVRGTCRLGCMPCNGLLYTAPHPCDCYISSLLRGMLALAPAGAEAPEIPEPDRLVRGPAYDGAAQDTALGAGGDVSADDWPMYRRDPARSGHTTASVPPDLKLLWTAQAGGRCSAPVVAGSKVVVASADGCGVRAYDAATGTPAWSCEAGGAVDTPPTLWHGLALFGCRDGWVYCVRLSDGRLVWRFLAAPGERLVGAFGRIESAWPVNGSVLIQNGRAYVAAGRSSFLDGGIAAWCLDPATGRVLEKCRVASPEGMKVDQGRNVQDDYGVLADMLVGDGENVYMRNYLVFGRGQAKPGWAGRLSATGGMLDDSWFNRMFWILDGKLQGESLVNDEDMVYSVRAFEARGHQGFIEAGVKGYTLAGTSRKPTVLAADSAKKRRAAESWQKPPADQWTSHISPRIRAMALAGKTLLCAGTPDVLDPRDPWANYEGRGGGVLMVVSAVDGKTRAELKLAGAPVQDGIAVAGGRVYVSTANGSLMCFGAK